MFNTECLEDAEQRSHEWPSRPNSYSTKSVSKGNHPFLQYYASATDSRMDLLAQSF